MIGRNELEVLERIARALERIAEERPGFWAQADDLADHDPRCRCGRCGDPLKENDEKEN